MIVKPQDLRLPTGPKLMLDHRMVCSGTMQRCSRVCKRSAPPICDRLSAKTT